MMRIAGRTAAALIGAWAALTPLGAQNASPIKGAQARAPAAGVELWASTDSDHTDVVKLLARVLWDFEGPDQYRGIAIEHAWFKPQAQHVRTQNRAYVDLAGGAGAKWRWRARIGTNGHNVLGSATLRSADWSKELFIEREIVETPLGLDKGIYYTFAGASMDLPASERDTFNAMAAIQEFTGRNVRLHLRGSYVHVASPKLGLSVQLRTRYFHSTVPHEFDYYSPRAFFQAVPVVQMRRFDPTGWMYVAALGYGAQKATGSRWQAARLADLRIESPARSRKLQAFVQLQYSNNSLNANARNYHYVLARVGLTARLN
jgi:hypothetical protein